MDDKAFHGNFAIVECGRDPSGRTARCNVRSSGLLPVDRCQCLRAAGPKLHVFSLGQGSQDLSLDRLLRVRERAALQGFPDSIGNLLFTAAAGCRILGSAMSAPVGGQFWQ